MDRKKALQIIAKANDLYTNASYGMEGLEEFSLFGANGDSEYFQRIYSFIVKKNSHPSTKLLSLESKFVVNEILEEVFDIPNNLRQ